MGKLKWFILPVLLLVFVTPVFAATTEVVVGGNKEGIFFGVETANSSRKMVGFLGYEEDYYKGMIGLNIDSNQMIGYVQGGRQAFAGNLKYHVSAYAGNINFREDFMAGNRLGISGDVMQINGNQGYGVSGEINIIGGPGFSIAPYYEWRDHRVIQAMVGIGSHVPYLRLRYYTDVSQDRTIILETQLSSYGLEGSMHYLFADGLTLAGHYNSGQQELGLGAQWNPTEHPYSASLTWWPSRFQWTTSYRF